MMAHDELQKDVPAPFIKKTFVKKTFPEQEYNLHAERGKGQYICQVDANSPADSANLQPGDRIVGVDGQLIDEDNHKQTRPRLDSAKPLPRLCVLEKHSISDEFGFNLQTKVGRSRGNFVGQVDNDSIADYAGLELGQIIVGVNGELIYPNTPHLDVLFLIKKDAMHTELLVASEETDKWHRDRASPYSFTECVRYINMTDKYNFHNHNQIIPPSHQAPISSEKEK